MSKQIKKSLYIMVFGTFFGVLCSTLMNTALPTFMRVFQVNSSTVQWLTNGYTLVNAIMIPTSAYFIKKFSFRHLFIAFSTIFLVGTLIGAVANSFILVIIGRMIQAIGTGMMMPLVNVLAMQYTDRSKQGAVMGIIGLAFNFSPIIGPTLSGVILEYFAWQYLFILILPFIIAVVLLSFFFLPQIETDENPKFDTLSLITISFGLLFLLTGFSNIGQANFLSFNVLGYTAIGLILIVIFSIMENKSDKPIINFEIFHHSQFTFATIINMLIVLTMYGNTILLPLMIQTILHKSPLISGLALLPGATLTGFMSPISGRLFDKYPIKRIVVTGVLIDCFGTFMQAVIDVNASVLMLTVGQTVRQLGLVLILIPIQTHALSALPKKYISDGVATFNTLRQIAASFGTAIIIAVITMADKIMTGSSTNQAVGIQAGFLACLGFLIVALLTTHKLHRPDLN
ncbi:DHA2 family efflux MFS transporter permease subunit [Companilactobacillus suantsaicola]|uniref:DHA2 family efflux MFS transporter permease subunit n=1 Tax=Companilactobacillus suantsaicola TaxID=2487723 RepID=A0A4Z0JKX7_9LACO|nr:DHA2 family efflux MFS transporter permease subunit [Companilactobacillus suantsaicola]TGD22993.1 DHA2 family efflux MFS transporter permease subunit [Companilactobacillus suantsaicola]